MKAQRPWSIISRSWKSKYETKCDFRWFQWQSFWIPSLPKVIGICQCHHLIHHLQKHGCRHQYLVSIYHISKLSGENVIFLISLMPLWKWRYTSIPSQIGDVGINFSCWEMSQEQTKIGIIRHRLSGPRTIAICWTRDTIVLYILSSYGSNEVNFLKTNQVAICLGCVQCIVHACVRACFMYVCVCVSLCVWLCVCVCVCKHKHIIFHHFLRNMYIKINKTISTITLLFLQFNLINNCYFSNFIKHVCLNVN